MKYKILVWSVVVISTIALPTKYLSEPLHQCLKYGYLMLKLPHKIWAQNLGPGTVAGPITIFTHFCIPKRHFAQQLTVKNAKKCFVQYLSF